MKRMSIALGLVFAGASLPACSAPDAALVAEDGWIRAAPPGAGVMAGYVRLHNRSNEPVRCDAASGTDFGAVEIHRTLLEGGRSRMLRAQVVDIPAHGSAELAPGGYHLMLFRPQRPLVVGDRSTLTLVCGALRLTTEFSVRSAD